MPKLSLELFINDVNKNYKLLEYFSEKAKRRFHNNIHDPSIKLIIRSQCNIDDNCTIKIKMNDESTWCQNDMINKYTAWYLVKKQKIHFRGSPHYEYFRLAYSSCRGTIDYKNMNISIMSDYNHIILFYISDKIRKFVRGDYKSVI